MWEEKLSITSVPGAREDEKIFQLNGPLTITTLFGFRDAVRGEKTAKLIILDLSQVPYMDSAGVGAIVNAHVSCVNNGRLLALAGVQDRIKTLMKVTRVEEVLKIFPSVQEAEAATP
jgi:anti-sigma B factor antagonist